MVISQWPGFTGHGQLTGDVSEGTKSAERPDLTDDDACMGAYVSHTRLESRKEQRVRTKEAPDDDGDGEADVSGAGAADHHLSETLAVRAVTRMDSTWSKSASRTRGGSGRKDRNLQLNQADIKNELDGLKERAEVAHPGAEEATAEVTERSDRETDRVELEELPLQNDARA